MKLLNAISAIRGHRIPVKLGRIDAVLNDVQEKPALPADYSYRYELVVSCVMQGPPGAFDTLSERARRVIAYEVYGEVRQELHRLRRKLHMLYEESYRAPDDPVLTRIQTLIDKISGL